MLHNVIMHPKSILFSAHTWSSNSLSSPSFSFLFAVLLLHICFSYILLYPLLPYFLLLLFTFFLLPFLDSLSRSVLSSIITLKDWWDAFVALLRILSSMDLKGWIFKLVLQENAFMVVYWQQERV